MRSDLIAAAMVRKWLSANAPSLIQNWLFEGDAELDGFIERVTGLFPDIDAQFASQGAVAKTAIELWKMHHVALLGGGSPTPLTPRPDQLMYYTDLSAEVVAEVAQAGYNTRVVDVKNVDDLKQLTGATGAIATGLFHFLDEDAAREMLNNLVTAGFQTVIFNNMGTNVSPELQANWTKLGYRMFARTPADVAELLSGQWKLDQALTMPQFFQHNHEIGPKLVIMDNIYYIYKLVRV
jgi:hypothetical protein